MFAVPVTKDSISKQTLPRQASACQRTSPPRGRMQRLVLVSGCLDDLLSLCIGRSTSAMGTHRRHIQAHTQCVYLNGLLVAMLRPCKALRQSAHQPVHLRTPRSTLDPWDLVSEGPMLWGANLVKTVMVYAHGRC